jgi:hypothetical protein
MREEAAKNMYAFHPASDPNVASQPRKAGIAALEPQVTNNVVEPTVTPAKTEEANNVAEPTVTPDKTEEAKQPSFYSKFLQMTTPPVSAEEQARRTKAATAARGIGELGNALSALSNLTFAGVAPSQTLPSTEKIGADITSWQDKLKAERERYQQRGLEAIARDYEIAYRAAKDKEARELADRTFNEQMRQFNERMASDKDWKEYQKEQQTIENARADKQLKIQQQQVNNATRNAAVNEAEEKRKAEQYNAQYGDRKFFINGEWVTIPKDRWEGVVGSIYNNLPDEVKAKYETHIKNELGITTTSRKAPTRDAMDNAVRQYVEDPYVQNAILKAAGLEPVENVDAKEQPNSYGVIDWKPKGK